MSAIWAIAAKDFRLLLRDKRAALILLAMPLLFIALLGISLGEGFGNKKSESLRVSVLVLDEGLPRAFDRVAMIGDGVSAFTFQPGTLGGVPAALAPIGFSLANGPNWFPHRPWSEQLLSDLGETAGLHVEHIGSLNQARELVKSGKRGAILVLGPDFSKRVARCSFLAGGWRDALSASAMFPAAGRPVEVALAGLFSEKQRALPLYMLDGINPFHRDGVNLDVLDVQVLRDPTQETTSNIMDQVAQGSMLRIIMPWMIGRAFEKLADPAFLTMLGKEPQLPAPVRLFLANPLVPESQKRSLSVGLQNSLQNLFPRYNLTAKTWAALTKEKELAGHGGFQTDYAEDGSGWLRRGSMRYQLLVPAYLVMFTFFLVLTAGWTFVAERRLGTWRRLRSAPITRLQVIAGKLLPLYVVSVFQGLFILAMGKLLFDMHLGSAPLWLVPVAACTSASAMGLATLVASLAKTENQVAVFGALLVLLLAGLSGCLMGDRSMLPDSIQQLGWFTPHAWALDAYRQLLLVQPAPNFALVGGACLTLLGFGLGFLLAAWVFFRVEE